MEDVHSARKPDGIDRPVCGFSIRRRYLGPVPDELAVTFGNSRARGEEEPQFMAQDCNPAAHSCSSWRRTAAHARRTEMGAVGKILLNISEVRRVPVDPKDVCFLEAVGDHSCDPNAVYEISAP